MRVKCICDLESIGSGGRGPVPPGRTMVGDGSGRPKIVVASMPVGVAGELVEGILLIPVGVMGTAATAGGAVVAGGPTAAAGAGVATTVDAGGAGRAFFFGGGEEGLGGEGDRTFFLLICGEEEGLAGDEGRAATAFLSCSGSPASVGLVFTRGRGERGGLAVGLSPPEAPCPLSRRWRFGGGDGERGGPLT